MAARERERKSERDRERKREKVREGEGEEERERVKERKRGRGREEVVVNSFAVVEQTGVADIVDAEQDALEAKFHTEFIVGN